jgi:N-acetylmuramic acid 6-phosphate etherase
MPSGASRRFAALATERPHPATRRLDRLSTGQIVAQLQSLDRSVVPAVAAERRHIAAAAELAAKALQRGGRLLIAGAGTSGRLAVLEAAECPPTFGTPPSRVQGIMAGGRSAVFRSKEGAEDDEADGRRQIRRRARKGDVVIGVAASGVTPFTLGALREGKRLGCATVLITSNVRPSGRIADVVVCAKVGPEALTGSTRLKAGTAAKMALNQLTTAAMVRTGRAYRNWMVDLKPASAKLRNRALRIVGEAAGLTPSAAHFALSAAGGHVKTAILMSRLRLTKSQAQKALAHSDGFLARALGEK